MEFIRANRKFLPFVAIIITSFFVSCDVFSASISSFTLSTDTVEMNIAPTSNSAVSATGSHTATIKTDCATGYKVYVSMASNAIDNKLHLNGNSSNNSTNNTLSPVSGSLSSMSALSTNTWGVRSGTGDTSSTFAAVPTYSAISTHNQGSNPTAFITSSTASTSGTTYTITYGANANGNLVPGQYSANVLYTAIMNSSCYTTEVSVVKGTGIASVSLNGANPTAITNGQKATYNVGSTATASYTLSPGYHYSHWTASPDVTITKNNTAGSGNTVGSGTGSFTVPGTGTTVSPQGAANTYTIKYNAGTSDSGSAGTTSQTGTYGGNVTTSTKGTLAKTGYDFKGWAHSSTATTATYNANTATSVATIASNAGVTNTNGAEINLYPVWTINQYTISMVRGYLGNSGTTTSGSYNYGTQVDIRANIGAGYHFTSWSSSNGGTFVDSDSTSTKFTLGASNTTLTANQAPNTYSVVFNGCSNTGGSMSNQSFTYDTAQNLTANAFTRTGYSFAGWATGSCSGTKAYNNSASANNLTATNGGTVNLYALWTINNYTLTTANDDTTHISAISEGGSKQYNSEVTITCTPTTGYSCFWYNGTTKVSTGNSYTFNMPANDLTLTAKSAINQYTITMTRGYLGSSGTTTSGTYNYGTQVDIRANITATGYHFTSWSSSNGGSFTNANNANTKFTLGASNTTLTANQAANSYSVVFNGCSNTGGSMGNQSFTYDTAQNLTANAFSRTGYTFAGWATGSCSGTKAYNNGASANNLTSTNGGTVNLYALWSINSYSLTTTNGDTDHISTITAGGTKEYNSSVTISCTPTTGYSCSWYNGNTQVSTGNSYTFNMPANDLTLTAKASINSYTISMTRGYLGTSGTTTSGSYNYGAQVDIRANITATGYHFSSWSSSNGGTFASSTSANTKFTLGAGNTTLTANQAPNTYSVKFNGCSNTGGSMNNQGFTYDTAQNLSSNGFSRTGYTFAGWATDSCSGTKVYNNGASANNLTSTNGGTVNLYALWSINNYTLTTANDDTDHISAITAGGSKQYNSSVTITCTPTTGYSCFWYNGTTKVSTGNSYTFNMPANDLTLTAKASINSYTVTASNGNTTAISSVAGGGSKTYGTSVTVTCTPKPGYRCTGWTSSDTTLVPNSSSASYTFTMPAGNVTLTATAVANTYTINVNKNGGSDCMTPTFSNKAYTSNITVDPCLRTGYDFLGYAHSQTATSPDYIAQESLSVATIVDAAGKQYEDASITLYAVWSIKSYTITMTRGYIGSTGTTTSGTYNYGTQVTIRSNITTGYHFTSWSSSNGGTFTNANSSMTEFTLGAGNTTLTANQAINSYSVKFNGCSNTGGTMSNQSFTYGTAQNLTANAFTRSRYVFAGWATSSCGGSKVYNNSASVNNLTTTHNGTVNLYAVWRPIASAYNDDDDEYDRVDIYLARQPYETYGEYCEDDEEAECDFDPGDTVYVYVGWKGSGWTFSDWRVETASGGTVPVNTDGEKGTFIMPLEPVRIYAEMTGKPVAVSFNGCSNTGGTSMATQHFAFGSNPTVDLNTFTRTYYEFAGWSRSSCSGTAEIANGGILSFQNYTTSRTLYAIWKPIAYAYNDQTDGDRIDIHITSQASYNNNSWDATGESASKAFNPGDRVYIKAGWVNSGTSFQSWTVKTRLSGTDVTVNSSTTSPTYFTMPNEPVLIKATTAPMTYGIKFYQNTSSSTVNTEACTIGGTISGSNVTITEGQSVEMPAYCDIPKSGYDFLGWAFSSSATTANYTELQSVNVNDIVQGAGVSGMGGATISMYAIWKYANPNTITYIQDFTEAACTNLNGSIILEDKRDTLNKEIYVEKVNGNCYTVDDSNGGVGPFNGSQVTLTSDTSAGTGTLYYSRSSTTDMSYYKSGIFETFNYPAALRVCPKGWSLPSKSAMDSYLSYWKTHDPGWLWMNIASGASTAQYSTIGSNGYYYWTSTTSGSNRAYYVNITNTGDVTDVTYSFSTDTKDEFAAVLCMKYGQ